MMSMMETMLRNPDMQKMLYPYLPEAMRNPQSIEWMLSNPEVKKQMAQMFESQVWRYGKGRWVGKRVVRMVQVKGRGGGEGGRRVQKSIASLSSHLCKSCASIPSLLTPSVHTHPSSASPSLCL